MQFHYSYPTAPTISVKCLEDMQSESMDDLVNARIPPAMDVGEYNNMLSAMEQAYWTAHPDCWSSVPVAAVLLYDAKSRSSPRFIATQMGESVIPPQQLLKRLRTRKAAHARSVGGAACDV